MILYPISEIKHTSGILILRKIYSYRRLNWRFNFALCTISETKAQYKYAADYPEHVQTICTFSVLAL